MYLICVFFKKILLSLISFWKELIHRGKNFVFFLSLGGYALIFFCNPAFSLPVSPPDLVYRLDSRHPDTIFAEGFQPMGENRNLIEHLSGRALELGNSAFISTTSTWSAIERFVSEDLEENAESWVYEITPTDTFYDVNGSMLHANLQNPGTPLATQALRIYREFGWQEEFASVQAIPSSRIAYAYRVRVVNGNVVVQETRNNPNYVPTTPTINPAYYTDMQAQEDEQVDIIEFDDDIDWPIFPASRGFFPDIDGQCGSGIKIDKSAQQNKRCKSVSFSVLDNGYYKSIVALIY
ncbi:scabin-related ADP-ribosyltransferase [Tenebrionicola larvae]|jgi:hypothetical protein|uniref:scabin-related ADP-ribosyltransferase n=1 Tax=Tenebrionicola larvae TaxID=2815733 RepID=UPI002013671D|nr:hypothetical protein [Tenebrionicola larvae]